jgi:hypothetical protein
LKKALIGYRDAYTFQLKRRRTGGPDGSSHQLGRAVALADGE